MLSTLLERISGHTNALATGLAIGGLNAVGAYHVSLDPAKFHVLLGKRGYYNL